jgi:hypothetical protein
VNLPVEVQSEVNSSLALAESAGAIVVATAEQYLEAGGLLRDLKGKVKVLEDTRKRLVAPFVEGKKALDDFFKAPQDTLKAAIDRLGTGMVTYDRKQRDEAARLQREADARAAAEQARLNAVAEAAREAGKPLAAAVAEAKAANVEAVSVPTPVVKVAGLTFRDVWKFRVVDANLIPREFLCVDEAKLGKFARDSKGQCSMTGVEFYTEQTSVGR